MKVLVVIAALLAVANCLTSSEELLRQHVRMQMLKRYISERQQLRMAEETVESICPGYGEKFQKAMEEVSACMDEMDIDEETVCSAVKKSFEKCMKPIVGLFEKCLPEKSKEIPSFLVKSTLAVFRKLCTTDGEHIFELSNQCIRSENYRTKRCLRRLETKMQQYQKKELPSKSEACDFLRSLRVCLESHLAHSCGNPTTREAFMDVFDAGLSTCGASYNNEIEDMSEWSDNAKVQYTKIY